MAIIGLVENMSYFLDASGRPVAIFGQGGGEKLSQEFRLPLLEKISIDLVIGKSGDSGVPFMISSPDSDAGRIFQDIAEKVLSVTQ